MRGYEPVTDPAEIAAAEDALLARLGATGRGLVLGRDGQPLQHNTAEYTVARGTSATPGASQIATIIGTNPYTRPGPGGAQVRESAATELYKHTGTSPPSAAQPPREGSEGAAPPLPKQPDYMLYGTIAEPAIHVCFQACTGFVCSPRLSNVMFRGPDALYRVTPDAVFFYRCTLCDTEEERRRIRTGIAEYKASNAAKIHADTRIMPVYEPQTVAQRLAVDAELVFFYRVHWDTPFSSPSNSDTEAPNPTCLYFSLFDPAVVAAVGAHEAFLISRLRRWHDLVAPLYAQPRPWADELITPVAAALARDLPPLVITDADDPDLDADSIVYNQNCRIPCARLVPTTTGSAIDADSVFTPEEVLEVLEEMNVGHD